MRRLLLLAGLALVAATPAAAQQPEPQTSLADLEDEVMCVVCGVTLELATEAPQAIQERQFIRELIAEGLTKDEVKDRLVDEFGSEVLAVPDGSGFDLVAWLVPGLVLIVAAGATFVGVRRWRDATRDRDGDDGDDADEGHGPGASNGSVSAEDAKRLEQDLARYDL